MIKAGFATLILLSTLLFSCGSPPVLISASNLSEYDYVVARAGEDFSLTMPQLHKLLRQSSLVNTGGILSADQVRDFADSVVLDTLMGLEAADLDLRVDAARYMLYRRRYETLLRNTYMEHMVNSSVSVDSAEVAEHYYGNEMYQVDEQVLVSHITMTEKTLLEGRDSASYTHLSKQELADKIKGKIYDVYELLLQDSSFESMARKYSHYRRTAAQGGAIGWIKRGWYADPFDSVAFSLEPGTFSEPYLNRNGWHVLYVKKHMEEGIPPLTEEILPTVWSNLLNLKGNERAQTIVDSLHKPELTIVYNEPMLEADYFKENITTWVAIVNETDSIFVFDLTKLEGDYREEHNIPNTSREMKKEMISVIAAGVLITQAARHIGIDTLPQVVSRRKEVYHASAKEIVMGRRFDPGFQTSKEAIAEYYEGHIDSFTTDKPLEVQHIICEDSLFCEYLRDQAMAGVDFLELAAQYYPGDPDVRVELANMGRIGPGDVDSVFYEAASITKLGTISHPVKTRFGYHIIRLLNRYDSKSLGQVRPGILSVLNKRHYDEFYKAYQEELFSRYDVSFPGKIHKVHLRPWGDRQG